eukprot:3409244-Prymnesium_polylepis.4
MRGPCLIRAVCQSRAVVVHLRGLEGRGRFESRRPRGREIAVAGGELAELCSGQVVSRARVERVRVERVRVERVRVERARVSRVRMEGQGVGPRV